MNVRYDVLTSRPGPYLQSLLQIDAVLLVLVLDLMCHAAACCYTYPKDCGTEHDSCDLMLYKRDIYSQLDIRTFHEKMLKSRRFVKIKIRSIKSLIIFSMT